MDTGTKEESVDIDSETHTTVSWATDDSGDTATATESEGETESADVDTMAVYTDTHTYLSIDVGRKFVCGITTENHIVCWGENEAVVSQVPSGAFVQLAAGRNHVCAIADTGEVVCWGDNAEGQCDAPEGQFSDVAAGRLHSCAISTPDGSTVCWGDNLYGQTTPPNHQYTEIQAHEYVTCGLRPDKTLECWGDSGIPRDEEGPVDSFSLGSYVPNLENHVPKLDEESAWHVCYLCYVSKGEPFCANSAPHIITFPTDPVSRVVAGSVSPYWLLENGIWEAGVPEKCISDPNILQQQNEDGGFVVAASAYGLTCGLRPDHTPVCWSDCISVYTGTILR